MTNEERKEKLAEIFGQQAEYFEEWFCPDDFDERDVAVAKKIGKPLDEIRFDDVVNYIDKERTELAKEFNTCIIIAKDAQKHTAHFRAGQKRFASMALMLIKTISVQRKIPKLRTLLKNMGVDAWNLFRTTTA